MMGRTTLREVREALVAVRSGEASPPPVTSTAGELELLGRLLEADVSETPSASRMAGASAEVPHEEPTQALQETGGA